MKVLLTGGFRRRFCGEAAVMPRAAHKQLHLANALNAISRSINQEIAYNSCRNRHCPKCQGASARTRLAEREADPLPAGYLHVVFTLSAEVADAAFQNKALVYDLLFRATSETLLPIAADRKHLRACISITAVLHTNGSAITHHPHVHMIVPGDGITLRICPVWLGSRRRTRFFLD